MGAAVTLTVHVFTLSVRVRPRPHEREGETTMADIELDEAIDLLSDAAEEWLPDRQARVLACDALMERFESLKLPFVQVVRDQRGRGVWLQINGGGSVLVHVDRGYGKICIIRNDGAKTDVPLRLNRLTSKLEGTEFDKFHAPVPGEAIPRRSALATVIEAALPLMKP